jgi:outer membrane receptor protein involved in Fe transport
MADASVYSCHTAQESWVGASQAPSWGAEVVTSARGCHSRALGWILAVASALCAPSAPAETTPLEEIEVTGSRITRRDFQSASPIVSVPAAVFAESSSVSVERTLAMLPQFVPTVTGTSNEPSNDGQANLSLRGIGVSQTLVLVDGKRLMPADGRGSVDVNVLPPTMIESVEVVTGGASAAYGSDAIAGVVNFRLRDEVDGLEFDGDWSQTGHGDGQEYSAGILAGTSFADGRGEVVAYVGYAEREQVDQGDRRHTKYPYNYYPDETNGYGPSGAFLGGGDGRTEDGYFVIFSNPMVFSQLFASYGYPPGTVMYYPGVGVNDDRTVFRFGDDVTPGSVVNYRGDIDPIMYNDRFLTYNTAPLTALQLPLERTSLFLRGQFNLSESVEGYAQAIYADYSATRQLSPADSGILLMPMSNPYMPADLRTLAESRANPSVPFRFFARPTVLGPRTAQNDREMLQLTVGLRGQVFQDWRYDVYAQAGRNERTERQDGITLVSKYEELLFAADGGQSICGGLDVFGKNRITAECAAYVATSAENEAQVDQTIAEASISGPLFDLPAGELQVAVGVFHKRDEFDYVPDPVMAAVVPGVPGVIGPRPDASGFGAGAARSGNETNTDLYLEARAPILRDAATGRSLELGVGYRHSQYEQAGGAGSYKAELNFRQSSAVMWRGSFQHAVRAPSVEELYSPEIANQFVVPIPDPCSVSSAQRTGPDQQQVEALCLAQGLSPALLPTYNFVLRRVDGVSGGNPDLETEEADTLTAGIVLDSAFEHTALADLQLAIDWYRIDFGNGIGRWETESAVQRCFDPAFNPDYDPAYPYCTFFTRVPAIGDMYALELDRNIGGVDTSGIDVQVDWAMDVGPGRLGVNGYLTHVQSWEATEPDGRKVDYVGTIGNRGLGGAIPRWRWVFGLRYQWRAITVFTRWQHIDGMRDAEYRDFRVPSYDYFDVGASYAIDAGMLNGLTATAGVENLGDKDPPLFPSYPQANTDPSQYDVLGRRYFVSLRYRFR